MPADLGTRKGATLADVSINSPWLNGFEWMKLESSAFPVKSYDEINNLCFAASDKSN